MSERVLIMNIGERDLYYQVDSPDRSEFCHFEQGKPGIDRVGGFLACRPWGRDVGAEIHRRLTASFSDESPRCAFPILEAVLDLVTAEKLLDRLVLVATDQAEQTPAHFRDRDTIYSAKIAKRIIEDTRRGQVRLVEIAYYRLAPGRDQAYAFYGNLLAPLVERRAELHVCVSGSIPALNTALQEQAFRLFRGRDSYVYEATERPTGARAERPTSAARLVAPEPFLRDFLADMIERLLMRYDYSGALDLLLAYRDARLWDDYVAQLLRHAERRASMDPAGAESALPSRDPTLADLFVAPRSDADFVPWAEEMLAIAEVRYQAREFPEVAWRVRSVIDVAENRLKTPAIGDQQAAEPFALINSPEARKYKAAASRMLHHGSAVDAQWLDEAVGFLRRLIASWARTEGREIWKANPFSTLNARIVTRLRQPREAQLQHGTSMGGA